VGKKTPVTLPVAPLPDLVHWWNSQNVPAIVIGGLAVAILGRARVTRDIDGLALLREESWASFIDAGRDFNFVPRLPDTLEFAHESRVLLLRHQSTGIDVDISLGSLPFEEEAIARAQSAEFAGVSIPLPTPEDLIIMKAIAHRERDLLDIEGLLAAHPKVDTSRIREWVRRFADTLEAPELLGDIEHRLARLAPKKRRRGKS
jgi:hypothetical protein